MKGLIFLIVGLIVNSGCTTSVKTEPKSSWKVLNKSKNVTVPDSQMKSSFVPSGTELVFTQTKVFNEKNNNLNIELSPNKRCNLSTNIDKAKQSELTPNTILTVVGYRGETGELVLSEPSYQQYYISCVSKFEPKRKVASKPLPAKWKKASIEINDIEKMSPLLKVKFIPQ